MAELELIGWQWRFVFPTHAGAWTGVSELPKTIKNGTPVFGHDDCHFEVRDVFAGPVGDGVAADHALPATPVVDHGMPSGVPASDDAQRLDWLHAWNEVLLETWFEGGRIVHKVSRLGRVVGTGGTLREAIDAARGVKVRHFDLKPPAEFFHNGERYQRKNNGQSVKLSDGSWWRFDAGLEVTPAPGVKEDGKC